MKKSMLCFILLSLSSAFSSAQDRKDAAGSNLHQYYSGKFGFYAPSDGMNNGLLIGVDGITEFVHYSFFISGAADLYVKQTIAIFTNPQPQVVQQQMILIPLSVSTAYKIFEVSDADSRAYAGIGGGYYLYFYSADYNGNSQSVGFPFPTGTIPSSYSASNSGGNVFGSIFVRFLIGKIFLEPKYYVAAKRTATVDGGYTYVVNPTGFAITLGFQYH